MVKFLLEQNTASLGFFRVAVVTPKLKVAAVDSNLAEILSCLAEADSKQVALAVFPELCLSSYSAGDLFFQKTLLSGCWRALYKLQQASKDFSCFAVVGLPALVGEKVFNLAALVGQGKVWGLVPKTYLPNSFEYYEKRWFAAAHDLKGEQVDFYGSSVPCSSKLLFAFPALEGQSFQAVLGLEICEDLWAPIPPSSGLALAGATVLANLSASSEAVGKKAYRRALVTQQSAKLHAAYLYASAGPGESSSDVGFLGQSMISENGQLLQEVLASPLASQMIYSDIDLEKLQQERAKNPSFVPDSTGYQKIALTAKPRLIPLADLTYPPLRKNPFLPEVNKIEAYHEIVEILAAALWKRVDHIKPACLILGLSGGLDSTLTLLLSQLTIQKFTLNLRLLPVLLPGVGTSPRTWENATKLCAALGLEPRIISIQESFEQHLKDLQRSSEPVDLVFENAQARIRTLFLMSLANAEKGLMLGTSDLSEIALGFSTYNGDQTSMYHLIGGVPKTLVQELILFLKDQAEFVGCQTILEDIVDTPISPELKPLEAGKIAQKTEEILGPYQLHDFFLYHFYRFGFSAQKIRALAFFVFRDSYSAEQIEKTAETFFRRFFANQFKRAAMPDAPRVGSVSFSSRADWRMPSDVAFDLWKHDLS